MPVKTFDDLTQRLHTLSPMEFLELGTDGLAYIRPMSLAEEEPVYSVFAANGSHIATGQDLPLLHAIARQHNLIPLSVQ